MYLAHFGLNEYPFGITPDTDYFFSSGVSQEALNTLLVAVKTGEGFIKITGEVGTGKTLLCRKLLSMLDESFQVAYIPNPYLEPTGLFIELASELGISLDLFSGPSSQQLLRLLNDRLIQLNREGKRVVVCLDEVQAMPIETLEALRLLTNLETEKRKLLQVIIFGQPELEDKLNHSSIRQLRQRIVFEYRMQPMSDQEIDYYVHHRLAIAGFRGGQLFSKPAFWMLRYATKCIPRLVNIVAHKALLSAFGKGRRYVSLWDVNAAVNDTPAIRRMGLGIRAGVLSGLLLASVALFMFIKGLST